MKLNRFATTAAAALFATAAFAENTNQMTDGEIRPGTVFDDTIKLEFAPDEKGYFQAGNDQILASTLIGKYVYNGKGEEAQSVGDVNDVIMDRNGKARAVIIGVGGFLGIGEKDVAVDFNRVSWYQHRGEKTLVIEASREELENAPAYDRDFITTGSVMKDESKSEGSTTQ